MREVILAVGTASCCCSVEEGKNKIEIMNCEHRQCAIREWCMATEESCPLLKRGLWIIEHGLVLLGKISDPLGLPSYDYFPVTSLAFL